MCEVTALRTETSELESENEQLRRRLQSLKGPRVRTTYPLTAT